MYVFKLFSSFNSFPYEYAENTIELRFHIIIIIIKVISNLPYIQIHETHKKNQEENEEKVGEGGIIEVNNGTTFYCVFYNFLNIFEGILLVQVSVYRDSDYCFVSEILNSERQSMTFVFKLQEKEVMRSISHMNFQ